MKVFQGSHAAAAVLSLTLLSGCVMAEKYEAEKARAMNFQRLLAQEEKRTGELDSELKRIKRDYADVETRNRELAAQIQAVREQMARIQEEATAMRDAAMLKDKGAAPPSAGKAEKKPPVKPKKGAKASANPYEAAPPTVPAAPGDLSAKSPRMHEVRSGETLFAIGRQYGVDVATLRKWNGMKDDTIEIGQRLIVGVE